MGGGDGSESAGESEEKIKSENVSLGSFGETESDVDAPDTDSIAMGRAYLEALGKDGGIELLQEDKTLRVFQNEGFMVLFALPFYNGFPLAFMKKPPCYFNARAERVYWARDSS
ncbi:hypothetical protein L917_14565 [Phytophthora nicotianae]|uniref:Uncharacterized protein n=1 Tax=Phytophthora nicotianae TaxID=4792 RepID=W2KLB6_PHYNI|nr:hypothetical protein L917_14565 [Phytophthora nicotianae]